MMKYPLTTLAVVVSLLIALVWLDLLQFDNRKKSISQAKNAEQGIDAVKVDQDHTVLTVRNRPGGVTYEETLDLQTESQFSVMGVETRMIMDIKLESETSVSNLEHGGQALRTVLLRAIVSSKTGGFEMTCDTDNEPEEGDVTCNSFYDMVGVDMEFTIDELGSVATSDPNAMLQDYSPSKLVEANSRLLKLVPMHPVEVDDRWDASVALDGIGYFTGTSEFLGFVEYEGNKCASILTNGTFDMDFDGIANAFGGLFSEDDGAFKAENCSMVSKLYWDDAAAISRWSETEVFMTLRMKNPFDDSFMTVPIHETITTTCSIKG